MKVAMMQPTFMPWQGFFELVFKSNCFIFLDDFQFSYQSFHQRNRLFVNTEQVGWYSVPVDKAKSFKAPLNQTLIQSKQQWQNKMWQKIHFNYRKTPYFNDLSHIFEEWLFTSFTSLSDLNIKFIKLVCELLGFKREFRLSSTKASDESRSKRILELLRWCGATQYFCAKGSFGYMKSDEIFPVDDIKVLFQDFTCGKYPQQGNKGKFEPYLSIFDALMNIGPQKTAQLLVHGTHKWLDWSEMEAYNKSEENQMEHQE